MSAGPKGEFHARLERTPDGLFRALYAGEINPDEPDERAIPDMHLSSTEADARAWVEQIATGLGYTRVVWEP